MRLFRKFTFAVWPIRKEIVISLSRDEKKNRKTIQWIKFIRNCNVIGDREEHINRCFGPLRVPKLQIFFEIFARIYRAQYGAALPFTSRSGCIRGMREVLGRFPIWPKLPVLILFGSSETVYMPQADQCFNLTGFTWVQSKYEIRRYEGLLMINIVMEMLVRGIEVQRFIIISAALRRS